MRKTIEYLNAAKTALNIESDYEMAKRLGIQKQTMSGYRTGIRVIDNYAASRIAEALGIDPMEVIAAASLEREKDEKRRDYWRQVGRKCAAACLVMGFLGVEIKDLQAHTRDTTAIMRNWKRRILARIRHGLALLKHTRRRGQDDQEKRVPQAAA